MLKIKHAINMSLQGNCFVFNFRENNWGFLNGMISEN